MKHPSEDDLIRGTQEEHLRECTQCRRIARTYEELTSALTTPLPWTTTASPHPFLPERTVTEEEIRGLLQRAHDQLEHDPRTALELVERAAARLPAIHDEQLQHYLASWAARERANALRYLGEPHEALSAITLALTYAQQLRVGGFEEALNLYTIAAIHRELHQHEQALLAAQRAASLFNLFGEQARELHARFSIANTILSTGDHDRAIVEYRSLLERIGNTDPIMAARVHHNLGNAYEQLGDTTAAREHLTRALHAYPTPAMITERTRVRWALARVRRTEGHVEKAIAALDEVVLATEDLGLHLDAALAALDTLDLLLESSDERTIPRATALAQRFLTAGLPQEAATAMAHLRHAATSEQLTPALLHATRAAIEHARTTPASR
jgi:tetratricopeptide (TPR) repeat protein